MLGVQTRGPEQAVSLLPAVPTSFHSLFRVRVDFSKCKCHALIDTGAAASFVSIDLIARMAPAKIYEHSPSHYIPTFKTASGASLSTYGYYRIPFVLEFPCNEPCLLCCP
jgi:hypothetical protein